MKKCINYFTYLMVVFFSLFISSVSAANNINYDINPVFTIPVDFEYLVGTKCEAENFEYLEVKDMVYTDPSTRNELISLSVEYKSDTYPEEKDRVEKLHCIFVRNKDTGEENGDFYVNFTIKSIPTDIENIILEYGYDPAWQVFEPIRNGTDYMIDGLKSVTSVTAGADAGAANDYISVSCPSGTTTNCLFEVNDNYKSEYGDAIAYYDIEYIDVMGATHKGSFTITIRPNRLVFAQFMPSTTCNFNSSWSTTNKSGEMKANLMIGESLTLPTCTVDVARNPLYKFHGWIDLGAKDASGLAYFYHNDAKNVNTCINYPTVSTVVLTADSGNYYACYTSNTGIALLPYGGTMSPAGGTEVEGTYYYDVTGNFNLPKITKVPERFNLFGEGTFYGWSGPNGYMCNPNEETCTVPADGSYYHAIYSNNKTSTNDAQSLTVYVNEHIPIKLSNDITTCAASSSNITADISGGECFVFGVTPSGASYVDLTVIAGGESYIYKVKVLERAGNFSNWMDDVVIDLSNMEDYSTITGGGGTQITTSAGLTLCEEYVVASAGIRVNDAAFYGSFGLDFNQYRATSRCDSSMVHLALCMDPGRPGPESSGATVYVVDDSFDSENEFGKVITHIVKEFVREGISKEDTSTTAKNKIGAANAAVRLAQYFSTEELASSSVNKTTPYYINAIAAYTKAGEALRNKCTGGLEGCSASNIKTALTTAWSWQNSEVLDTVVSYLSSYENTETISKINDVKNTYSQDPTEYTSTNIVFNYEGVLNDFGTDVNFESLEIKKDCEKLCSGSSCCDFDYTISGNEINYTFTVSLDENTAKKIPSLTNEELPAIIISSSETGYQAANVFVLKPRSGNYQRMAIFNLEGTKMRFPFNFNTTCDLTYDSLNPSSDSFNPTLFKAMSCCELIGADPAYAETYQYYCGQLCYSSNFQLYCNPNKIGATEGVDSYSIKEGKIGPTGEDSMYCIIDVTTNDVLSGSYPGNVESRKKEDSAGNKYVNDVITSDNEFCEISCREEWDISLPGFDNFLSEHAINAGGFFSIDKDLYFGSKRSCYSTFIDYEGYVKIQQELSEKAVIAYTIHSEYTQVYSILEDSKSTMDKTYKKWYYNSSEDYNCGHYHGCAVEDVSCDVNGENCVPVCLEEIPCECTCHVWRSTSHTCTVNTIETDKSLDFDSNEYKQLSDLAGSYDNVLQAEHVNSTGATSTDSLGSSSARTIGGGSKVYSYYREGVEPEPEDSYSDSDYNEGSCCGGTGYYNCDYGTVTHDDLLEDVTYKGNIVKSHIDLQFSTVENSTSKILSNAQNMSKCQNFYLQNNSSINTWNAADTKISAYGGKNLFYNNDILNVESPVTEIISKFEPEGSYKYEEYFFMALLAKEGNANVIIPFKEANNDYLADDAIGCSGSIGRTNAYTEDLKICRGYTEEKAYNPQGLNYEWTPDLEGVTYSGTGETSVSSALVEYQIPLCKVNDGYRYVAVSNDKLCQTATAVVYEINYLTRSLQNSSFYVNKGHWFVDSVNDVKGHGDTLSAAVANSDGGMKTLTSDLFGAKYNTFPIGLDTPRNIYQYSYAFRGLGIYPSNSTCSGGCSDNNPPGRIMGNADLSIIKDNVRTCFYEVFEDLCQCCGDPIVWYTHSTSMIDDTEAYLDGIGEDFDPSKEDYTNRSSNLGPKPSSVSLYDINGTNDRTLASNWSSSDPYLFIGTMYYTDKGSELLQHITSKGDTIYNNTGDLIPEYSYTLTPSILAQIRSDNVPYGYSADTIKVISKVCYELGPCDTDTIDHGFYHFGSKFLEGYLSSAQTPGFTSIIGGNTGASCIVDNATSGFNRNCRWVDYKTSDGHYLALK